MFNKFAFPGITLGETEALSAREYYDIENFESPDAEVGSAVRFHSLHVFSASK